jgi:predicted kinase
LKLILIRGLPGSGKSTLAKTLRRWFSSGPDYYLWDHWEADDFFVDDYGQYQFNAKRILEAHHWCQKGVKQSLKHKRNVIVSNTFTRVWEMQPYLDLAKQFGAEVTVLTCEGNYGNIHGVPDETIEKMRERWEPYTG